MCWTSSVRQVVPLNLRDGYAAPSGRGLTRGGLKGSGAKGRFRKCCLTVCFQSMTPKLTRQGCATRLRSPKKKTSFSNWPFTMDPEFPVGRRGGVALLVATCAPRAARGGSSCSSRWASPDMIVYCVVLYYTILYYIIVYYSILDYTVVYYIIVHWIVIVCMYVYICIYIYIYIYIVQYMLQYIGVANKGTSTLTRTPW